MRVNETKQHETKQQIFCAAAELFAQKGYPDVSIRDIAKKVNIKGASIYYHYASKEEILNDILDYYEDRIRFYLEELKKVDLDTTPIEECHLRMHLNYRPEEQLLMFWTGQVVLNEQFRNHKAAELLLGSDFQVYIKSYESFLKVVAAKMGFDTDNCGKYAELLSRISIVFMMQFQHADMFDAQKLSNQMDEMYKFVFTLFLKERFADHSDQSGL